MFQLLIVLGRFRRLVFGLPLALGALALGLSYALPVQFKTSVIIAGSKDASAPVLKSLVESDGVRDRVIDKFNLGERYGTGSDAATQLAFEQRVAARPGRDGLLYISVTDREPAFAAKLADAVAAEAIRAVHESRLSASSQEIGRVKTRLDQLALDNKATDERLSQEGVKNWQTVLPETERSTLATVAELQAEINQNAPRSDTQSNMLMLQDRLSALQRQVSERRASATGALTPAAFDAIKDKFYYAALAKLLDHQLVLLKATSADEIKTVAPAPLPLVKDSPKRLLMAVAGFALGLALALLFAFTMHNTQGADSAWSARFSALRQAWGLKN